tara:strand:- start:299 stop:523 length:225 start_codon:yes stop_codon:yes gene_type:complete
MVCSSQTPKEKIQMTAKHFKAIADTINKHLWVLRADLNDSEAVALSQLASELADQFEQFNPQFNRSKFLSVALA